MTEQERKDRFGVNLMRLIAEHGCTLRDFAEETGISETALNNYINGRRMPSFFVLEHFADVLDCGLDEFRRYR